MAVAGQSNQECNLIVGSGCPLFLSSYSNTLCPQLNLFLNLSPLRLGFMPLHVLERGSIGYSRSL